MSNDLRLNSIDRFRKDSERLVLEEHSHCEVPAGCGGVVLRWFNPNAGVPVVIAAGFAAEIEVYIDETRVTSGRTAIPVGQHVLAVHAASEDFSWGAFWLGALRDAPGADERVPIESMATAADGTWLAAFSEPPDPNWRAAGFDDSAWTPLRAADFDFQSRAGETDWASRRMGIFEARPLQVGDPGRIWIRKRFRMEPFA